MSAGPVALVTGAGRGIGRAIAVALAGRGARVVVNYRRDADAAAQAVAACQAAGGQAVAAQGDVADVASCTRVVAHAEQLWGPIDWCVANAGVVRDQLVWDADPDAVAAVIRGNLRATWATLRTALPGMVAAGRGSALVISSVSAHVANPGQSAYATAKAESEALVRELAREVGPSGVRVNALVVGLVETDATASMTPRQRERALDRVPLARMATPAEVAHAAAWLLDDATAGYVTGACLALDGGLSATVAAS